MAAQGSDFNAHVRTQGQRLQDVVQLGRAVDAEYADIGPLANDPPQMQPFSLALQLRRALVFSLPKLPHLFRICVEGNLDIDGDMKEHGYAPETGVCPVIEWRNTSAYSDADC
jgi:hypothetical protein